MGVYDYTEKAILSLQMRIGEHDATNLRTLDVSRSQNHALFGAGAAAPTKLAARGYTFDGANDYIQLGTSVVLTPDASSLCILFNAIVEDNGVVIGLSSSAVPYIYPFDNSLDTSVVRFTQDSGAGRDYNVPRLMRGYRTLAITRIANSTRIYMNGVESSSGVGALVANLTFNQIGGSTTVASYLGCNVLCVECFQFGLTPIQVSDWHFNILRRVNDV